jgi:N-acetyl-gamma-glutamyl-phosphate reductase
MRKKGSRSLPTGGWVETLARVPKDVKIVDICREHRCIQGWVYGMAEVWPAHIERQVRVANPGCFAAASLNPPALLLVHKQGRTISVILIGPGS